MASTVGYGCCHRMLPRFAAFICLQKVPYCNAVRFKLQKGVRQLGRPLYRPPACPVPGAGRGGRGAGGATYPFFLYHRIWFSATALTFLSTPPPCGKTAHPGPATLFHHLSQVHGRGMSGPSHSHLARRPPPVLIMAPTGKKGDGKSVRRPTHGPKF